MSSSFWRLAASRSAPLVTLAAFLPTTDFDHQSSSSSSSAAARCDAAAAPAEPQQQQQQPAMSSKENDPSRLLPKTLFQEGMQADAQGSFHGLFPMRQLFVPAMEFPLWNKNWDGLAMEPTGDEEEDRRSLRRLRKTGVTRHILLIRHGQYDESSRDDAKRILTPLGREQAHLTGKRIAEMMKGAPEQFGGPCRIKALRVSGLARAIETANIIAEYLPGIQVEEHDPMLNEGRPCHTIPGGPANPKIVETVDAHHPRIESAYRKYFYRAPAPPKDDDGDEENSAEKHEFEIIVCHANVIRYWMCRALQLPPEVWLRYCPFNCSLTYLTIRPTGTVSCRMLGDIGHLPYDASTFSGHHGFNW